MRIYSFVYGLKNRGGVILKLGANEIESMIQEQRQFYHSGETKTVEFRKKMLHKLYDAITAYEDDIIDALKKDLGKSAFESYTSEIGFVLSSISYMVKHVDAWMAPKKVKTPLHLQPAKSYITREPYGSILIISPFNYPFQLVMEPLIGAITAGNCAVVKPSEFAPETSRVIRTLLASIYPPEFVRVIEGEQEETSLLIHASFDYIFFTGSARVGKIVMKAAAEKLTPITLELGGKSPVIVDQTANLKHAAERILWGKFLNAGQTCVAPDYLLVHTDVKEALIDEMLAVLQKFYGKNPRKSVDYGRIIHTGHFDRLKEILEKEARQILIGGQTDLEELYIAPTLLMDIEWSSAVMEEEIFGPILPILTYVNLGEAIDQIRQKPKPLAAYLFTENEQAAHYFTAALPFGGGCINDTVSHVANIHLPFGGVGNSGMNAYHGKASFELFTHAKSMMNRSTKIPMKMAFPPYGDKLKVIKRLLS